MDPERGGPGVFLKGGQLASMLAYWVLSQSAAQGRLPEGGVVAHNMVTSPLMDAIADDFPVQVRGDLPIGFKYIAMVRDSLQDKRRFIMGSEMSFGTLIGAHCGEKDAAVAALAICEVCDHLRRARSGPRTILELLQELWLQHGYYAEETLNVEVQGETGMQRIAEAMCDLRRRFPVELGGRRVLEVHDVLRDTVYDPQTGQELRDLGMGWEGENILIGQFGAGRRDWVIVRPSGTEPSLKMYCSLRVPVPDRRSLPAIAAAADDQARRIQTELRERMGL
jgi:phosphomannomutase